MITTKENIIKFLNDNKEFICRQFSVKRIALSGSYARGEEVEGSDIDILIDTEIRDFKNRFYIIDVNEVFKVVKDDINILENEMLYLIKNIGDKTVLYKALECAIEDLNKIHRKESIDYLQKIKEKL